MEKFLVKIIIAGAILHDTQYLQDWHDGGGKMKAIWHSSPYNATQYDTYPECVEVIKRLRDESPSKLFMYQIEKVFI